MKSRVIVVGLIQRNNTYLVGRKPTDCGPYPNTSHILGGGVDLSTESLEDAFRREIREEAGIEIDAIQRVDFDEDTTLDKHGDLTHYIFLKYVAQYKSGELHAGDDILEVKWVSHAELPSIDFNEPSKKLLKKLNLLI